MASRPNPVASSSSNSSSVTGVTALLPEELKHHVRDLHALSSRYTAAGLTPAPRWQHVRKSHLTTGACVPAQRSLTSFRTLDGLRLAGTFVLPDGTPDRAVVLVHGGGVTRDEGGF